MSSKVKEARFCPTCRLKMAYHKTSARYYCGRCHLTLFLCEKCGKEVPYKERPLQCGCGNIILPSMV